MYFYLYIVILLLYDCYEYTIVVYACTKLVLYCYIITILLYTGYSNYD